jgi:hypothetical protein
LTISDLSSIPPNPDQYGSSKKGVNGSLDTTDTKDIICVRDMTELRSRIANIRTDPTYFIPKLLRAIKIKSTGKVQINQKTPIFNGTNITIRDWLFKFELTCSLKALNNILEENMVKFAANNTQGYALCVVKKYIETEGKCEKLAKELTDSFSALIGEERVENELSELKHRESLYDYLNEFLRLTSILRWDDEAKFKQFMKVLKDNTRTTIRLRNVKTFEEARLIALLVHNSELDHTSMNAFSVQDDKRKTCQICQDRRHTADKCLERKESGKPVDVDNKKGEKGSQDKKNNRNDVKKESQKKIQSKENNSNNKIPKSINNSKASGDIECYKCKRKGHIKKICPLILNTNMMEVKFNSMEMANLVIKVKSAPINCKNQEFVLDLDNFEVVEMGARKMFYVQGIY